MAWVYYELGDKDSAKMYFTLAKKMTQPIQYNVLEDINEKLAELGGDSDNDYDLVFDSGNNTLTERKKGRVDFKSQFILMDLMKLFVKNPGEVFSKEALVNNVWKQDYNPAVHDNKIYVTIKRLRKMVEPDYDKPKYIFRSKQGYYLNKTIKVMMNH